MADAPAHHLFVLLGIWTDPLAIKDVQYDTATLRYLTVVKALFMSTMPKKDSAVQTPAVDKSKGTVFEVCSMLRKLYYN